MKENQVMEALGKQLQLLSKRSEDGCEDCELVALTEAMCEISRILLAQ